MRSIARACLVAFSCIAAAWVAAALGGGIVVWSAPSPGQRQPARPGPTPTGPAGTAASPNKGRLGTYQCVTSHAGHRYVVYVPRTYSDDNPAGLHVFIHGPGGALGAGFFDPWARTFLEPFNLIGINMQHDEASTTDDPSDIPARVDATIQAIRQTMADYKVVFGRGAIASFSTGGLSHEMLFAKLGRGAWPFNHSSLFSSKFGGDPSAAPPMSWFISVGTFEWVMRDYPLGVTQMKKAEQLLAAAGKGGCPDVHFRVVKDRGHSLSDDDIRAAAVQFRRSDLALAPFLYEKDFNEPALAPIARQANALAVGKAAAALDRLLADPKTEAAVKDKAVVLKKRIDDRAAAMTALARELAESDPVLCLWYAEQFARQLEGHPVAAGIKDLAAAVRKKPVTAAASAAFAEFRANFRNLFEGNGLRPGAGRFLESVRTRAGQGSLLATMASEMLAVGDPSEPPRK